MIIINSAMQSFFVFCFLEMSAIKPRYFATLSAHESLLIDVSITQYFDIFTLHVPRKNCGNKQWCYIGVSLYVSFGC